MPHYFLRDFFALFFYSLADLVQLVKCLFKRFCGIKERVYRFILKIWKIILSRSPKLLILCMLAVLVPCGVYGARANFALDATHLAFSDGRAVALWGVKTPEGMDMAAHLRAREALNAIIRDNAPLVCDAMAGTHAVYCKTAQNMDVGLALVQNGVVVVDRQAVRFSALNTIYTQSEDAAKRGYVGIWAALAQKSFAQEGALSFVMFVIGGLWVTVIVAAGLMWRTMQNTQRLVESWCLRLAREEDLHTQERSILATMLETELRANKTKAEAFLIMYNGQLEKLRNADIGSATYRRAGDVVYAGPALQRVIFDKVADRVNLLGPAEARALIAFYKGLPPKPEYTTLTPTMPVAEAETILEAAITQGRAINMRLDNLIKMLEVITAL